MNAQVLLLLCFTLLLLASLALAAQSSDEANALLEFFAGITGSRQGEGGCSSVALSASVKSSSAPCPAAAASAAANFICGVWCGVEGSVVAVRLAGQGLRGSITPNSLAKLKSMTILDLSDNQLSGSLPEDLGTLPNLQVLDLSQNSFNGSIPSSFGGLSNLLNLSLANNHLQGAIPPSFGALHRLASLNLSSNSLNDVIPVELSQMEHLTVLDLHSNQLSGEISPAFLGLSSLMSADLSNNKLTGFVPWQPNDTLPLLRSLQFVNLSYNQLTGPLAPPQFASVFAEKLEVLDVSHNQLSGNLPDFEFEIGLVTLRLSHNFFTGAVPSTLLSTNLGLLEELDLSNNNLTGSITRVLSTSLVILNMSYNMLSGMVPQKVGSCAVVDLSHNELYGDLSYLQYWSDMLEVLDLSFNHLSGKIIDEVSRFVRLRIFSVSHNALVGSIPPDYGNSPKLTSMDLSFNRLNGMIPASFFNSSSLSSLLLSSNELSGSLPLSTMDTLGAPSQGPQYPMTVLDLSSNKLSGRIPEGIGMMQNLKLINMSSNSFLGPMPSALCNLTSLLWLDLSTNLLSGSIPGALPSTLIELHLSENSLSGLIPENLKRFPESSFFPGNNGLISDWAGPFSGSNSSVSGSHGDTRGMHTTVKAGLIGGVTAGLFLILVSGLFLYHRHLDYGGGSAKPAGMRMGLMRNSPCAPYFPSLGSDSTRAAGLLSGRTRQAPTTAQEEAAAAMETSSWDQALKLEPGFPKIGNTLETQAPMETDTPVAVKVQSPDRLAGDLHFLDKSLQFTAEELSRAPAEVLGRSSHGTTYKATLDNGHVIAVKWLREGLAKSRKDFSREAKKFAKFRHPNLNPLRGYYWGPREHEKLLLSDYSSSGSLAAHFSDRTGQGQGCAPLSWQQRLVIAVDIVRGVLYLHDDRNVPHGNLKATNVLIDDGANMMARLTDYSLHLLMTPEGTANQILNAGALGYRAPELATVKRPKPSMKGDVYALGVLMLELLTGKGAGDILSGQSGAVDLTDWVRLLASEKRLFECFDPVLLGTTEDVHTLPKAMEEMAGLALRCISQQMTERPSISMIYDEVTSLSL